MTALALAPFRPTEAMKRCNQLQLSAEKTLPGNAEVYAFLNDKQAFPSGDFRGMTPAGAAMKSESGLSAAMALLPR